MIDLVMDSLMASIPIRVIVQDEDIEPAKLLEALLENGCDVYCYSDNSYGLRSKEELKLLDKYERVK